MGLINHAKCYKIKDSVKLKAIVDLYTPNFGPDSGCSVKKAKSLCVPAHKQVTEATINNVVTSVRDDGEELTDNESICYKIKCAKQVLADQTFLDQFGIHQMGKLKASLLCVPAIKACADTSLTFAGRSDTGDGACRDFDGNEADCNSHFMSRSDNPMACTYNTTLQECHGCGGGGDSQPGCVNSCLTCADGALNEITDGNNCNSIVDESTCTASWHGGGFGAESCFWDSGETRCRGCGPPNEIGEGNCSVTTAQPCFEDTDCPATETCVDHTSVCENACRQ
jgi:hypothetical protein